MEGKKKKKKETPGKNWEISGKIKINELLDKF